MSTDSRAMTQEPSTVDERRERIAKAMFDAFRDGFEEAYGERPEGWAETSEYTRVLWRDHADALLPTEGEPEWKEGVIRCPDCGYQRSEATRCPTCKKPSMRPMAKVATPQESAEVARYAEALEEAGEIEMRLKAEVERLRSVVAMIHAQDWGGLIEWAQDHGCLPDRHGADRIEEYEWKGDHHEDARYVSPMRSALIKAVTGAALNPETNDAS